MARRFLLVGAALLLLAAGLTAYSSSTQVNHGPLLASAVAPLPVAPPPAPPTLDDLFPGTGAWTERTLEAMTLEEKVAQLFSARAYGSYRSADDPRYLELVQLVEEFGIGSVTFFQGDPITQAVMANDLQQRARVPLLVAQDMEWGPGQRLEGAVKFPRTMATGATGHTAYAYTVGYTTAVEARAMGTHFIFAPVADVNNNPQNPIINVRSFGEDPEQVAAMVSAFVNGAQDGGVISSVKHFPGHGDTDTDSHLDLPVLPYTQARLDTLELVPFRRAINEGVKSVMTAHLAFPALEADTEIPGSLSPRVSGALLRDELGFDGLVVTDGLDMRGVSAHFSAGEAAIMALEAGADLLLLSVDEYAAHTAVVDAVRSGRLTEARIEASARRVLRAKEWLGLHQGAEVPLDGVRDSVRTQRHEALAETVARASLTLLGDDTDLLPFTGPPRRLATVTLSDSDDPEVDDYFLSQVFRHGRPLRLTDALLDRRSDDEDYAAVLADLAEADVDAILVPTYLYVRSHSGQISLPPAQRQFLNTLLAGDTPVVLLSFGNPYMVMGLGRQPAAYLAAYGGSEVSQKAAAQALFGQTGFQGRLPINIPGTHALGDGLQQPQTAPRAGYPNDVGMRHGPFVRLDSLLRASIANRAFPGAAVAVGRGPVRVKLEAYGYHTYAARKPVQPTSAFDLASLTKVVATTTAAMQLYEAGQLDLDRPLATYLPAFGQRGKADITVRQVLTHTSGLIPFRPFHQEGVTTREAVLDTILASPLIYEPGTDMRYSDFNMIALALAMEQITDMPFEEYTERHIFEPLGMRNTGFRRAGTPDPEAVPTEQDPDFRQRLVQGEVHDETAWILGGTAGHAGLFSTAEDLARFGHMLVEEGRVNGQAFLQPETVRLFTSPQNPAQHTRALGWDTKSPEGYSSAGTRFGPRSFGHTGFTGTSFWVDPDQELFVILLTNRVYPTRENRGHIPVRPAVADLVYSALVGPPTPLLPAP
ncbi:MAG: glycoside hydrolase family 3 N-terminal domain-containing protein [Bacteroidota bacterium]